MRKYKEKKEKFRKLTVEKEMQIAMIIEEKQEEEEDLIEIKMVEKMVSRKFYKYLKVLQKKTLERILMKKT